MASNACKFYTKSFKRNLNAFHNNSSLFIQAIDQQYDCENDFSLRNDEEKYKNGDTLSLTTASLDEEDIQYGKVSCLDAEDASFIDSTFALPIDRDPSRIRITNFLSESIARKLTTKAFPLMNYSKKLKISNMLSKQSSFVSHSHKFKVIKRLEFLLLFGKIQKLNQKTQHQVLKNIFLIQSGITGINVAYLHPYVIRISY